MKHALWQCMIGARSFSSYSYYYQRRGCSKKRKKSIIIILEKLSLFKFIKKHIQIGQRNALDPRGIRFWIISSFIFIILGFLSQTDTRIKFDFSESIPSFRENYFFGQRNHIIKKKDSRSILYSIQSIPKNGIFQFQIRIVETKLGMISIGVFTHDKLIKDISCGFCQDNQMYYIYAQNGKIYHGNEYVFFPKSKPSLFDRITNGDKIGLVINQNINQLVWYVNGKHAQTQLLERQNSHQLLYPFIIMETKGDQIQVV